MDIIVRPMALGDVSQTVETHIHAFRGFFLTELGPRFLELFYEEAVQMGEIALIASTASGLIGFVMGTAHPGAFYSRLIQERLLGFALRAVPAVIRRPSITARLLRALRKPREAAKPPGVATLLSIGVAPPAQGLGAGQCLVSAFIDEARRRGATKVDLTTDKFHNQKTVAFYSRLGFRLAREIVTPEGRVLNELEVDVPAAPRRTDVSPEERPTRQAGKLSGR